MYHNAVFEEPLIRELDRETKKQPPKVKNIPRSLSRTRPLGIPTVEEPLLMRHFLHLSHMNYGVDTGTYPLGSCTMKYNPKIGDEICNWDLFRNLHPYQHPSTTQGSLEILFNLEEMLAELTGMDAFTLQPAAGAQGEFLGMLLARAYHESNGENRDEVIIPDTAHGTNPASAAMAGYKVVEIPSNKEGTVDLATLEKTVSHHTACFMLTNPNTLGIFESDITEIAQMVHDTGALLYYDGANMNAIMGKSRPGDMGFDIVHLNLHKTFSTPHGGGGPGGGPIGVKTSLESFLPVPRICKKNAEYFLNYNYAQSIGKVRGFYGNFEVLLRAYAYILLMGGDGLTEASEIAVLNANYMKEKLTKSPWFTAPFKSLRKHEFVISCERLLQKKGVRAMDVAKRLLDFGVHPPTVYFPLIVKEALMIEPTESESKDALDRYIDILISIADEDAAVTKGAPYHMPVSRVDEAQAVKNPILTWDMM